MRFVTFTTVSFYSRGFKHNLPVIKSTTLSQTILLLYNGEQCLNLHSTQKVRIPRIKKLSPLTLPSVVIFGHRHNFDRLPTKFREGNVSSRFRLSVILSICSQEVTPYDHTWTCSNLFEDFLATALAPPPSPHKPVQTCLPKNVDGWPSHLTILLDDSRIFRICLS